MNQQKQPVKNEPLIWQQNSKQTTKDNGWVDGIDRCASCPNNPLNGGSGICHCTIPLMYGPGRITA